MNKINIPAVEEFTTPNPITATEDFKIEDLNKLMKENGIRHLPIIKNQKIVGIVSDRDVKFASGLSTNDKNQLRAGDIMVVNPVTVTSTSSLDAVAMEMSSKKIGSVIVYDENDVFLGIFTATDALNALIEIVRELKNSNNSSV